MALYFAGLVPHDALLEEINDIKQEIKEKFGPKHALKLPPHITLQIPFNLPEAREPFMEKSLRDFSRHEKKTKIFLDGFAAFKPRVVYLKILNPEEIIVLQERLQEKLQKILDLKERELVTKFHPHITLATRDVKKEIFTPLWQEFKERRFKSSFLARELVVFKHNGRTWDIWRRFPFVEA